MSRRHVRGRGTFYKEEKPNRKTKWVGEQIVRLPDGTRRRVRVRARTLDEAVPALERKILQAKRAHPAADKLSMEAFMDRWLEHKEATVRASTMHAYRQDNRLYIKPHLGGVKLGRLSAYQVQAMLSAIQAEGSNAMADRVRRTIKQALRQAVKWELLASNPVERLDPIKRAIPKRGIWTPPEVKRFLEAAKGSQYFLVFLLALSTGLRKGEILALTWRDITPQGVTVKRTQSLKAEGGTAPPKTSAGERRVPLPATVRAELEAMRNGAKESDLLFPGKRRGAKMTNQRSITREFDAITGRVRPELPEIRFHDLRRTYATMLAASGTHPRVMQKLLGHASPVISMNVYTDVLAELEDQAIVDPFISGGKFGGNPSESDYTNGAGGDGENGDPEGF